MIREGRIAVLVLLAAIAIAVYSNTFDAPFHYDDFNKIVDNTDLHWDRLSLENIGRVSGYTEPIVYLSFSLNYYANGLNVREYHYVNFCLHILTAASIFFFVKSIFDIQGFNGGRHKRGFRVALLTSLLWLVSPLNTQAVNYISHRGTIIVAMSNICAMLFYLRCRSDSGVRRTYSFLAAAAMLLIFMFAGGPIFALLSCLLLLEIFVLRGGEIHFLLNKKVIIPLLVFIGTVAFFYYTPLASKPAAWSRYAAEARLLTGIRAIVDFYIMHMLVPLASRLSLEHDFQISRSLIEPSSTFIALIAVCGLLLYAILSRKRHPVLSFYLLWSLCSLTMEAFSPISEDRLYLPLIGFYAILAIGVDHLIERSGEKKEVLVIVLTLLILVALSVNAHIRNGVWKDGYALWSDVIDKSPNIDAGYIGLGDTFLADDDYNRAFACYKQAKSISPRSPAARYGLGVAYFNLKKYDEAIEEFGSLGDMGYIDVGKGSPISYYFSRIARNYYGHGREEEALILIGRASHYDPDNKEIQELREKLEKRTLTPKEIMRK